MRSGAGGWGVGGWGVRSPKEAGQLRASGGPLSSGTEGQVGFLCEEVRNSSPRGVTGAGLHPSPSLQRVATFWLHPGHAPRKACR